MRRIVAGTSIVLGALGLAPAPSTAADAPPAASPFVDLASYPGGPYNHIVVDPVGGAWLTTDTTATWVHYDAAGTPSTVDVSALGQNRSCNGDADALGSILCQVFNTNRLVAVNRDGSTTELGTVPPNQQLLSDAPSSDGGTGIWYYAVTTKQDGTKVNQLVHRDGAFAEVEARDQPGTSPGLRVTPDGAVWISRGGGYIGRSTPGGTQWVRVVELQDHEGTSPVATLADSSVMVRLPLGGWVRVHPDLAVDAPLTVPPLVTNVDFAGDGSLWGVDSHGGTTSLLYVHRPGRTALSVAVPGATSFALDAGIDGTVMLGGPGHLIRVTADRPFTATTLTRSGNEIVGEPQTLVASVVTEDGSAPHGSVTFLHDGASIGTAAVGANGTAQITWPMPDAGSDMFVPLTATFVSDGATYGSTSPLVTAFARIENVYQLGQDTDPSVLVPGVPITLTEHVGGNLGVIPRGQVRLTFAEDRSFSSTTTVAPDGTATFVVTFYAGDYSAHFEFLPAHAGFRGADWLYHLHVSYPDAASRFVNRVFEDLLGRPANGGDVAYWKSRVGSAQARTWFALAIATSDEFRSDLLTSAYERVLGRAPDPGGLAFWVGRMKAGMRIEDVLVFIVSSDEYFAAEGDDPGTYIDQVYDDVLGRSPDPGGRAFWLGRLGTAPTALVRSQVVSGIIMSDESLFPTVDGYYRFLLGRPSDPGGLRYWVTRIQSGARDEEVIGLICGSAEYYDIAMFLPLTTGPAAPVERAPRPWAAG